MAEITKETVRCIEEAFARKEDFPLTIWEKVQLARAWEKLDAMRCPECCRTEGHYDDCPIGLGVPETK